ncbi:uncharacterized protein V3H86_009878 [Mergus octosetaceus]
MRFEQAVVCTDGASAEGLLLLFTMLNLTVGATGAHLSKGLQSPPFIAQVAVTQRDSGTHGTPEEPQPYRCEATWSVPHRQLTTAPGVDCWSPSSHAFTSRVRNGRCMDFQRLGRAGLLKSQVAPTRHTELSKSHFRVERLAVFLSCFFAFYGRSYSLGEVSKSRVSSHPQKLRSGSRKVLVGYF